MCEIFGLLMIAMIPLYVLIEIGRALYRRDARRIIAAGLKLPARKINRLINKISRKMNRLSEDEKYLIEQLRKLRK